MTKNLFVFSFFTLSDLANALMMSAFVASSLTVNSSSPDKVLEDNPKFKGVLSKSEYEEKYKDYLDVWEDKSSYLFGEWRLTCNEATEGELGDYLEATYEISRKRLEKYLSLFNNVKLTGVDIKCLEAQSLNGDRISEWYDHGKLIIRSIEYSHGDVYNYKIERFWRGNINE